MAMELLPALRDAEGDLAAWRRSPLRPLIETQRSLLILAQARASDRLFKRLLTAGRGLAFGLEELPG
jgi:hypothetical protein